MTAERASWHRLAARLAMPVQELQHRTTSLEFLDWLAWMDEEAVQPPTRLEQYIASVALEVRRLQLQNARSNKRTSLRDVLLRFAFKSRVDTQATALTPEELEAKRQAVAQASKSSWLAWAQVRNVE